MNTQENKIPLLEEVLDQFENGDLIAENEARKVYLTQQHQAKGIITWIHDHELRGHSLLRKMGKSANRDLLRQTKEKL
jgi:hypothetical protein